MNYYYLYDFGRTHKTNLIQNNMRESNEPTRAASQSLSQK